MKVTAKQRTQQNNIEFTLYAIGEDDGSGCCNTNFTLADAFFDKWNSNVDSGDISKWASATDVTTLFSTIVVFVFENSGSLSLPPWKLAI